MKHKIIKVRYETLMEKLKQTTIITDGQRKIIIAQRRDENANSPEN